MDALLTNDVEVDGQLNPAQKLAQAIEMMGTGIRLKRTALRLQFPNVDDAELDRLLTAWLAQND